MIKILLQNEVNILKNSHFKTRKQVCIFLVLVILGLLFVGGITWLLVGWVQPLLALFPPLQARALIVIPFLYFILLWSLFSDFLELLHETRTKFYLSPELSLLFATPVPAATLFFYRFILTVCFSRFSLWNRAIFVIAPLIALGIATAASWHYYLFILPVVYLLRIIGAAVGSLLSMLSFGILTTRRLMQVTVAFGVLSSGLWVSLFIFLNPEHISPWLLTWVEIAKPILFLLTDAVDALNYFALGEMASASGSLLRLFLASVVILGGSMLAAERIYSTGYDRSQTIDVHTKKQAALPTKAPPTKAPPTKERFFLGRRSNIILMEWKKAACNYEMAPSSVFLLVMLLIYVLTAGRMGLPEPWQDLLLIGHVGIIGFLVSVAVIILFVSGDMTQDIKALREKQYGLLKAAPLGGVDAILCYWLAPFIPQITLVVVMLLLLNLFVGASVLTIFYYMIASILLIGSVGALNTAVELAPPAEPGEAFSLISNVLRSALPFGYYIVVLGILAVGKVYTEIGFLSLLHHLPPELMIAVTSAVFLGVVGFTLYYSFRLGAKFWEEMEI